MSEFARAALELTGALDRCAIPYMIGGSVASGIHGIFRTSLDVDLVADIDPAQVAPFVSELGGDFYADADMIRESLASGRSFNVIHFASSYKFDIFPLLSDPFQQSQFSRRAVRDIELGAAKIAAPVATAEDTVLMKLSWYRAGGGISERQWNDIRGIVAVQKDRLDQVYLHHWAKYLQVGDLLNAALSGKL